MANVSKRVLPSGNTVWLADYRDGAGKRRFKQFPTRKEADLFLGEAKAAVRGGAHVPDSQSITVAEAAKRWLARGKAEGLEASTMAAYDQHVRLHIVPLLGARKISQVTTPAVEAFKDELAKTRSRAMVRKIVSSLSGIFAEAQRHGQAGSNPVAPVKVAKKKRGAKAVEMPDKAELRAMLVGVPAKWKPLLWTSVFTGMRASELRGLRWSNIDLDAGVIRVRERVDLQNKFGPPKTDAGSRDIPMAPSLAAVLREWQKECPKGDLGLAFPNGAGNVEFHQNLIKRFFNPLQTKLGITVPSKRKNENGEPIPEPRYGIHALRHAAASLFIEQGLQVKRVQKLMGHATVQITMDTYAKLFKDDDADQQAMAAIAKGLIDA